MTGELRYQVTDMHAAGEPVRIVTAGAPPLHGDTLLAKRRDAMDRHDRVRRHLMLEPRGHADMYGVWPTGPHHPEAALAVLFMHNGGYSTMCGHATIALGRWVLDQGLVEARSPETRFVLECPCGPVPVRVAVDGEGRPGRASFESVPAFAALLDARLEVPGIGAVTVDVGYGGAFYVVVPASRLSLDLVESPFEALVDAGRRITAAGRAALTVRHADEPDLGFLYGTILTDDVPTASGGTSGNLCVFGGGQVDRSPTGSGVTARLALAHARGEAEVGSGGRFRGLSGVPFTGEIASAEGDRVRVAVGGASSYTGEARFVVESEDTLSEGLAVPERLGELWGS